MITEAEKHKSIVAMGREGRELWKVIDSLRPFVEIYKSEIGQQFLKDDIIEFEELVNKSFNSLIEKGEANQSDVIQLRLLHARIKKIAGKLEDYQRYVSKVKNF